MADDVMTVDPNTIDDWVILWWPHQQPQFIFLPNMTKIEASERARHLRSFETWQTFDGKKHPSAQVTLFKALKPHPLED